MRRRTARSCSIALALGVSALASSGCSNGVEGSLFGAGLGAGGGAVIGSMFGAAGPGAAIGAVGGALIGGVIGDQNERADRRAYATSSGATRYYDDSGSYRRPANVYVIERAYVPGRYSGRYYCD